MNLRVHAELENIKSAGEKSDNRLLCTWAGIPSQLDIVAELERHPITSMIS